MEVLLHLCEFWGIYPRFFCTGQILFPAVGSGPMFSELTKFRFLAFLSCFRDHWPLTFWSRPLFQKLQNDPFRDIPLYSHPQSGIPGSYHLWGMCLNWCSFPASNFSKGQGVGEIRVFLPKFVFAFQLNQDIILSFLYSNPVHQKEIYLHCLGVV